MALSVFSLLFFAVVLFFSLRPGEILTWIGKVLNPLFLCFLGILIIRALVSPMGEITGSSPEAAYASQPFFKGFLEGYNTMDALAGLAFGIVIVNVIRGLGVEQENAVAANTVRAGIFSSVLMAAIYLLVTAVGAQSRGCFPASANGGTALAQIAEHYFGSAGAVILAVTVTMACLKTAVGLITSCGATFERMFSRGPSYRVWAVLFCVLSFLIANLGLNAIIGCSMPVLMFLYPLAVTLILLTLFGRFFSYDRSVCAAYGRSCADGRRGDPFRGTGIRLGMPGRGGPCDRPCVQGGKSRKEEGYVIDFSDRMNYCINRIIQYGRRKQCLSRFF